MTISKTENRWSYAGTGSQTVFQFKNKIFADTDILVWIRDAFGVDHPQTLNLDYTVSYVLGASEGDVVFVTAPLDSEMVILKIQLPYTQAQDIPERGNLASTPLEDSLDRAVILVQQVLEIIGRAPKFSEGSPSSDMVFPEPEVGKYLKWNAAGQLENTTLLSQGDAVTVKEEIIVDLQKETYFYALAGGTANALTFTPSPPWLAYLAGMHCRLKIALDNTGAITLNVSGLGAVNCKKMGIYGRKGELQAGELLAGMLVDFIHDGTDFITFPLIDCIPKPNLLINGGFQIWQDGISYPTWNDDYYTADMTILLSDGNGVVTVTAEATDKPATALYSHKMAVAIINKKFGVLIPIEYADILAAVGKKVSLSFQAKTTTGKVINNIRAAVLSWDGTADAITSDCVSAWNAAGTNPTLVANWTYENTPANLALSTSWQTFKIDGIDIDTSGVKNLAVFIWCDDDDAAIADELLLAEVNLIINPLATPIVYSPYSDVLRRCQRYYEIMGGVSANLNYAFYVNPGGIFYDSVPFKVKKRSAPTVTLAGTWAVVACNQPAIIGSCAIGFIIGVLSAGGGNCSFCPDSTDDVVLAAARL